MKIPIILEQCHASPYEIHFGGQRIETKVFQYGFYWPTIFRDAKEFCKGCDQCLYKGLFPPSYGNLYIIVVVDMCHSG